MGQTYSQAIVVPPTNFATGFPLCEIISTATDLILITEVFVDVFVNAAATVVVGFGTPAASGVTPALQSLFQAEDQGASATVFAALAWAWAKPPTAPAIFARRQTLTAPATGHGEAWWRFADGFCLTPGATAVLWCITGTTTIGNITGDVHIAIDN